MQCGLLTSRNRFLFVLLENKRQKNKHGFQGKRRKIIVERPTVGRTVSCKNCGNPTLVYPADPDCINILLESCPKGDSIERSFECQDCKERNTIYWDMHLSEERNK
jgi:DNA-directed RNA polymerase subunit M/transcription elongation factor TFIIS